MTKTVYIVRSNQDGITGVFTNKKLAYQSAKFEAIKQDAKIKLSYSQVLKEFKNINHVCICNEGFLMVNIHKYQLNNRY